MAGSLPIIFACSSSGVTLRNVRAQATAATRSSRQPRTLNTLGEVEPATAKSPRRGEIRLQLAHEKIKAGQNNLQQGGQPPAGTRASTPERVRDQFFAAAPE